MAGWPVPTLFLAVLALLAGWSLQRTPLSIRAVLTLLVATAAAVFYAAYRVKDAIYRSIQPLPPTERQLAEVDGSTNPLFRHVPGMNGRIAWRPLGQFPTLVEQVTLTLGSGKEVTFWAKREDRASSLYGGNKVRSLQYQLAVCEAHAAVHPTAQFLVLGYTGSNQCVATIAHGRAHCGINPVACWFGMERPSRDNLLNLLSCLSFGGDHTFMGLDCLKKLIRALWLQPTVDKVFPVGGNNPLGQLGHVGAALELAEQIEKGEVPDPRAIYLTAGSMCTVTGLILGVCLARAVGLRAFQRPDFALHAVHVHHLAALAHRFTGFLYSSWLPFGVRRSIRETSALLQSHGAPPVEQVALQFLERYVHLETHPWHVGKYGDHSPASKVAKDAYDASAKLDGDGVPLWLCGHFTAKGFSLLHKHLEANVWGDGDAAGHRVDVIFWSTKSVVQPRGAEDEWQRLQSQPSKLRAWAAEAGAQSPESYRRLMTDIALPTG